MNKETLKFISISLAQAWWMYPKQKHEFSLCSHGHNCEFLHDRLAMAWIATIVINVKGEINNQFKLIVVDGETSDDIWIVSFDKI